MSVRVDGIEYEGEHALPPIYLLVLLSPDLFLIIFPPVCSGDWWGSSPTQSYHIPLYLTLSQLGIHYWGTKLARKLRAEPKYLTRFVTYITIVKYLTSFATYITIVKYLTGLFYITIVKYLTGFATYITIVKHLTRFVIHLTIVKHLTWYI